MLPWPLRALGLFALLAALLLGCRELASFLVGGQLTRQARTQAHAIRHGDPLWTWQLHRPQDVVAARAFGAATLRASDQALVARSRDGSPFELGLPIARELDLRDWPLLRLGYGSDTSARLQMIVRATPEAVACVSEAVALPEKEVETDTIDLRTLSWRTETDLPCPVPTQAWMIRLRWTVPAGKAIWLSSAVLASVGPITMADTPLVLPASGMAVPDVQGIQISTIPWFTLPPHASAETMLAWRDRLQARWPAALILPADRSPFAASSQPAAALMAWGFVATYALLLLGCWRLRLRLRPRPRALLDILACIAGPFWLIAGLHWGGQGQAPAVCATLAALVYAIASPRQGGRTSGPASPVGGTRLAAWGWAQAATGIAGLLGLLAGQRFVPPPAGHVLAYLAWAALQQGFCLLILLPRCQVLLGDRWQACVAVAALFALMHTPNGALMQCCLLAETWWAFGYLRWRRFWPVVVAHAGAALLVEASLTGVLVRSLEVSVRFLN